MKRIYPYEQTPEIQQVITHTWEYLGKYIEVQLTIYRGRRITVRDIDSDFFDCNWCAGNLPEHAFKLVGLAKLMVEQDLDLPFSSRIKPYFNDADFSKKVLNLSPEPFIFAV